MASPPDGRITVIEIDLEEFEELQEQLEAYEKPERHIDPRHLTKEGVDHLDPYPFSVRAGEIPQ
jgi:hypothetical protein